MFSLNYKRFIEIEFNAGKPGINGGKLFILFVRFIACQTW